MIGFRFKKPLRNLPCIKIGSKGLNDARNVQFCRTVLKTRFSPRSQLTSHLDAQRRLAEKLITIS